MAIITYSLINLVVRSLNLQLIPLSELIELVTVNVLNLTNFDILVYPSWSAQLEACLPADAMAWSWQWRVMLL